MPLYKTIRVSQTITVFIWKIEEAESDLANGIELTNHCQDRMLGMKSEIHRKGFLSIRHLMAEAGYADKDLYYDNLGKPHLKDGTHISITHSHQFTGIIIGKEAEVGIDIEMQRDKIARIAHKFTPVEAYRKIKDTNELIRKYTIVWGCKESLYKIYATAGLNFLRHIHIADFSMGQTDLKGKIFYKDDVSFYIIKYLEFDGFTCVYAIKDKG